LDKPSGKAEREQSFPTAGRLPVAFRSLSAAKVRIYFQILFAFNEILRKSKSGIPENTRGQSGQGQNGQNRFRKHNFCSLLNKYIYLL